MRKRTNLSALLLALLLFSACTAAHNKSTSITEGGLPTVDAVQPAETLPQFDCDAVFFGDSITADSNFEDYYPELTIVNLGVYGDTLEDLLARVPAVQAAKPARIFLLGGINCLREDRFDRCVTEYAQLLDALRAACPNSELIVQSVLPVAEDLTAPGFLTNDTIRRFNGEIEALAAERGLAFVDLWPAYAKNGALDPALTRDGLHLNFTAYGSWAAYLAPWLEHKDGNH